MPQVRLEVATEVPAENAAEIVVIAAHPSLQHSRVARRLLHELARGAGVRSGRIDVRDLYALYPDYFIDVAAEQAALQAARLLVWLQPILWYSMPPLLKLWLDEVFAFGWAYGPGGTALRGKDWWLVASTGGPEASYHPAGYNRYFFDAFLPPYEQTARLTGMRWLPPLVLHGAHRADEAALDEHARVFAERLGSWPAWPELAELEPEAGCDVPADARPALATG
ncbi:MAG: NAD(P)H-dependent oxidoreductase [Burkholderiales bacterium]|nr:NAD(P)H-dependent oxidoreductase [Burkholderiales bacterium]